LTGYECLKSFKGFRFLVSGFTVIARRYDEATGFRFLVSGFTVIARRYDEATGFRSYNVTMLQGLKGLKSFKGFRF